MAKTIVITGSTSGLGKATADYCIANGAKVVICAEKQELVDAALADIGDNPNVIGVKCDVSIREDFDKLKESALNAFGSIDAWVNNAGTTAPSGSTVDSPIKFGELVISINLIGAYYGSIVAMRQFRQQGYGRLINITGRGEKSPQPEANLYSSAKAWVRNFTVALAKEEKDSAIEVGTFQPGLILTSLTNRPRVLKGNEEKMVSGLKKAMPIIGNSAEEIGAKLGTLLLSEQPIKIENSYGSFIYKVLSRLLTGRRAQLDLSSISPIIIEPEQ